MTKILFLFFLLNLSCGKAEDEELPEEPSTPIEQIYDEASERLVDKFLENDRVVSRGVDKKPENVGDSLVFSGLALYALPCSMGDRIERQLIHEILTEDGALMRHPTLSRDDASLDGALGLYFGIAERIKRCQGSKEAWKPAIKKHLEFVSSHDLKLNPRSDSKLEKYFDYVLYLLGSELGVKTKPTDDVKTLLSLEIGLWAKACVVSKKSCFRVHLGLLALKTIESLGENIPDPLKIEFCKVTNGIDMPTVDHYCKRGDLKAWIDEFDYNIWEYRHQRCGQWEKPDANGYETPALDYLVAMRTEYSLKKTLKD